MSRDMFATQQTPSMKAPSTPSMTPTRSVKPPSVMKRALEKRREKSHREECHNRQSLTETKLEARKSFSMTQLAPHDNDNFYHLRTRQVPLLSSLNDSQIWSLWGTHGHKKPTGPEGSEQRATEDNNDSRTSSCKCLSLLGLAVLMVLCSFIGAFCYAYFHQHMFNTSACSHPLQIAQDVQIERPVEETIHSIQLENSLMRLSEEVKHLEDRISKIQDNGGSEVISSPRKGILEELLTADLACAGNLGSVVATPDTTTVAVPVTVTVLWFLSFHVMVNHRTPQTTIEGLIPEVGDCWPFEGSRGRLVLKLHRHSLVSAVSISHIPPSISVSGDISSAPRLFQVLAHRHEYDLDSGQLLGEFEYKASATWRQTFPLDNTNEDLIDIIEFRFLENHGNPNYTCVYRVHVHGKTP